MRKDNLSFLSGNGRVVYVHRVILDLPNRGVANRLFILVQSFSPAPGYQTLVWMTR